MSYSPHSFNKALEQYVFNVASRLIDSVDQPTQKVLIDLVGRFTTTSAPVEDANDSADGLPLKPVSQAWQEILNQPIDWQSVHREWLIKWVQRQLQQQEKHVAYLEEVVCLTQKRQQLIQDTVIREPYRSNLLHRCEYSLSCFQRCLVTAQAVHEFNLKWLQQLQKQSV